MVLFAVYELPYDLLRGDFLFRILIILSGIPHAPDDLLMISCSAVLIALLWKVVIHHVVVRHRAHTIYGWVDTR